MIDKCLISTSIIFEDTKVGMGILDGEPRKLLICSQEAHRPCSHFCVNYSGGLIVIEKIARILRIWKTFFLEDGLPSANLSDD